MLWLARFLTVVLLLLGQGSFPHARAALGESVADENRQAPGSADAPRASTRQGEAQLAQRSEQAGGWGLPNPKKIKTYEVNYLWDGDELAAEIHSKEGTRVHVHRPGTFVPLLQVEGGEVFHIISDHLGTPKELVDEAGRVAWSAAHGAWNQIQEQWFDDAAPRGRRVGSPFRGLGQYYDSETGLSCTRYRYWEAGTGRWLSGDPIGIDGGANLMGYDGVPTVHVDRLGLCGDGKLRNHAGEEVRTYTGHEWSSVDPPIGEPPIVMGGPFTSAQRAGFIEGTGAGTKISPHHRHQLPLDRGGVIDEIPGPGHPLGNSHTKLVNGQNRHPDASYFNQTEGGPSQRSTEIRNHWKNKGNRLVEDPNNPGSWIDPEGS